MDPLKSKDVCGANGVRTGVIGMKVLVLNGNCVDWEQFGESVRVELTDPYA